MKLNVLSVVFHKGNAPSSDFGPIECEIVLGVFLTYAKAFSTAQHLFPNIDWDESQEPEAGDINSFCIVWIKEFESDSLDLFALEMLDGVLNGLGQPKSLSIDIEANR